MSHITTCTRCGKAYQESSEEYANAPERFCWDCMCARAAGRLGAATPTTEDDAMLAERNK